MANTKSKPQAQVSAPQTHLRSTPIGDYGFLSDGEVSALVSPNGAVEWMCVPRFDSPSVFGRILGRNAGVFRISPVDVDVPADVRYLPGTMILETSWGTSTGGIIVRDCLLMDPGTIRPNVPLPTVARPMTTRRSTSSCGPSAAPRVRCRRQWNVSQCSTTAGPTCAGNTPTTATPRRLLSRGRRSETDADHQLAGGSRGRPSQCPNAAQKRATSGMSRCRGVERHRPWTSPTLTSARSGPPTTGSTGWLAVSPRSPWRGFLQRSALTLKGLSYAPTGAISAAGTTSLPETPGGNRNYDYRFTLDLRRHVRPVGPVHIGFRLGGADFLVHRRPRGG